MTEKFIILLVALMFLLPTAVLAATGQGTASEAKGSHLTASVDHSGKVARIKGCGAEDGCEIDYKPSGVWTIKVVRP